ncbi:MAG TPA: S53 family peptidase [Gemmatimonadales bacterium]|nr:S53 family peptidase [Gemmatimonadales bacterium]
MPAGKPSHDHRHTVTLVLKAAAPEEGDTGLGARIHDLENQMPRDRPPHLTPGELAAAYGVPDARFEAVERFARSKGLEVVRRSAAQQHVEVSGTVAQLEEAFGVELEHFQQGGRTYQAHRGPVHLPPGLEGTVEAVIGLDTVPHGKPLLASVAAEPAARQYTPVELARRYDFPAGLTGAGQRIAIISFGGGFHQADLDAWFAHLKLPAPKVSVISVTDQHAAGPGNNPLPLRRLGAFIADMSDPAMSMAQVTKEMGCDICLRRALATFEVTMDIEIAGAIAPGAAIDVYFANPGLAGWRAAIHAAAGIRDRADPPVTREDGSPAVPATVISLSWGDAEVQYTTPYKQQIDLALRKAGLLGITTCCATGDLGSLAVEAGTGYEKVANVIFPSSSPYALACGGTAITPDGDEVAWNNPTWKSSPMATGGGVSGFFARPRWQAGVNVPMHRTLESSWLEEDRNPKTWHGRGVPDVAANADADSGYELFVGGRTALGGGTSAAAPLWAGLIALLNEGLSKELGRPTTLGLMNSLLDRPAVAAGLKDIVQGDNRLPGSGPGVAWFQAGPKWNACAGLGIPHGTELLQQLSK